MSSGATIGTVDTAGTFAESCGVVTMTASADTTGIWQNISTTGAATSVDSPTLSNEYVYGSYVDEPLALINSGGTYFYADNRVYSPAAMTDVWGAVVERYRYDSYGNRTVMLADDSAPKTSGLVGNQRGFIGYYGDAESELYYARARMYSPVLGRFVSRDPWRERSFDPSNVSNAEVPNRVIPTNRNSVRIKGRQAQRQNMSQPIADALQYQNLIFGPSALDGYQDSTNLYFASFIPGSIDSTGMHTMLDCFGTWLNDINSCKKVRGGINRAKCYLGAELKRRICEETSEEQLWIDFFGVVVIGACTAPEVIIPALVAQ
jgi:RHS repeat-associated protein